MMADLYGRRKWASRAQGWSHTLKNMKETGREAENPQVCVWDTEGSNRKGTRTLWERFQEANGHGRQIAEKGTRVKKKQRWTHYRGRTVSNGNRWTAKGLKPSRAEVLSVKTKAGLSPNNHQLVTPRLRSAKCWLGNKCPPAGRFHAKLWQSQRCPCMKKQLRG